MTGAPARAWHLQDSGALGPRFFLVRAAQK